MARRVTSSNTNSPWPNTGPRELRSYGNNLFRRKSLLVAMGCRVKEAVRMTALRTSPIRGAHTNKGKTTTQGYTLSYEPLPQIEYKNCRNRRRQVQPLFPKPTVIMEPFLQYVGAVLPLKRLNMIAALFVPEQRRCKSYQLTDH